MRLNLNFESTAGSCRKIELNSKNILLYKNNPVCHRAAYIFQHHIFDRKLFRIIYSKYYIEKLY